MYPGGSVTGARCITRHGRRNFPTRPSVRGSQTPERSGAESTGRRPPLPLLRPTSAAPWLPIREALSLSPASRPSEKVERDSGEKLGGPQCVLRRSRPPGTTVSAGHIAGAEPSDRVYTLYTSQ